jgi:hypothetical protein
MNPAPSARPSLRRYEGRRAGLIRTALRYGVEFGARRARKEAAAVPSPELEPAPSADSAPLMLGIFTQSPTGWTRYARATRAKRQRSALTMLAGCPHGCMVANWLRDFEQANRAARSQSKCLDQSRFAQWGRAPPVPEDPPPVRGAKTQPAGDPCDVTPCRTERRQTWSRHPISPASTPPACRPCAS